MNCPYLFCNTAPSSRRRSNSYKLRIFLKIRLLYKVSYKVGNYIFFFIQSLIPHFAGFSNKRLDDFILQNRELKNKLSYKVRNYDSSIRRRSNSYKLRTFLKTRLLHKVSYKVGNYMFFYLITNSPFCLFFLMGTISDIVPHIGGNG